MQLGLSLSLRPTIYQKCSSCDGTINNHASDCPELRIQGLVEQLLHIQCNKCGKGEVELNTSDYYECRLCHVQYTTFGHESPWERSILLDLKNDRPITTLLLPDRGSGKFKIDEQVRKWEEVRDRRRKRRKPRRQKHEEAEDLDAYLDKLLEQMDRAKEQACWEQDEATQNTLRDRYG